MANKLKTGSVYPDPRDKDNNIASTVYAVITQTNINHNWKTGQITQEIYPRACTQTERMNKEVMPIGSIGETITPENYDIYFDISKFVNGYNLKDAAYEFMASITETVEEEDEDGNKVQVEKLKHSKWESDEL